MCVSLQHSKPQPEIRMRQSSLEVLLAEYCLEEEWDKEVEKPSLDQ